MQRLFNVLFTVLLVLCPAVAQERVTLRYRFAPGETLRYRVEHALDVENVVAGSAQRYSSRSQSTRELRVQTADAEAAAIELVVTQMKVEATLPSGTKIDIDTSKNSDHPLARLVGRPLGQFKLMTTGEVRDWRQLQPDARGAVVNLQLFFIRFPTQAVAVGQQWNDTFAMPRPALGAGPRGSITFRRTCRVIALEGERATIGVSIELAEPEKIEPKVRASVAQFLMEGTVEFDVTHGRIVRTSYRVADDVDSIGDQGDRLAVRGTLHETLLLPVARR